MLVLTRRQGEGVVLKTSNGDIFVKIVSIEGKQVRVGFKASHDVKVLRDELDINANTTTKGGEISW